MRKYWRLAAGRALTDALAFMGWNNWPRLVIRAGGTLLVVAVLAWAVSEDKAWDRATIVGGTVAVYLAIGFLVFLYFFVTAPPKIWAEQHIEIDDLKNWNAQTNAGLASDLRGLHDAGQQIAYELSHRLQQMPVDETHRYWKWCDEVEAAMQGRSPDSEIFMWKSIAPSHRNDVALKLKMDMDAKMAKLRLIIGRYMEKPQLASPAISSSDHT